MYLMISQKNCFKISSKMNKLKITPSKVSMYSIKIAKDGVSRDANEILTQRRCKYEQNKGNMA